ncbi:hypothetical protein EPO15_12645 [bacterium]|nr:MAG: hypothetical protein EPO15_12645 [bacterium]
MRAAARAAWLLWAVLQWSFSLSLVVFMRGFFPPAFEAALAWRLPWAVAALALTAFAAGLPRAAVAAAAAAVSLLLAPAGGGGGAAALAAAAAAWVPFFILTPRPVPQDPRDAGSELAAAAAAALLCAGGWAAAARPAAPVFFGLLLVLTPTALAAASAARLGTAAAAAAAAWVLHRLLLAPLGLGGLSAAVLALPCGFAVALALRDAAALLRPARANRALGLAAAAASCTFAAAALTMDARPDWSHAAQGLLLAAGWAAVWLVCREAVPDVALGERRAAAAGAALLLVCLAAGRGGAWNASEDPALRALTRALAGSGTDDPLFAELWGRMGRPDRTPAPWDNPPPPRERAVAEKPDVFVFVVDSLRPDRLGRPGRTPALDALARRSWVFERAFTPFGGTHLAVPALWAGSFLPHGPLPVPFAPLNALERLLTEEGYRKLVAADIHVQAATLGPPAWETFDDGHSLLRRACPALKDLGGRLGPKRPGEPPVFAYAHLFDLHIAAREPGGGEGKAPGAAAVEAYERALSSVDACVGTFVGRLKALGRYDGAVVVVTADHGDSLGEEGRWGHAHTAFPEVLRIPLLLKVPEPLAAGLAPDTAGVALLSDVTPTLARLLGRGPWPARPGAGRSLARAPGEAPAPAAGFLVASSYAPVFGVVSPAGDELFLADAVDRAFSLFALPARGAAVRRDLGAERLAAGERSLRALLTSAARARG